MEVAKKLAAFAGILLAVLSAAASENWGSRTVFVTTPDGGVLRSSDGGANWIQSNDGLPHGIGSAAVMPVTVIAARKDEQHVYALTESAGVFPSLPRGFRGTLEISADSPIHAIALRSTSAADRFLLAALPVESLEVLRNDAVLYLPQIVGGAGFSSEIFVMNLGSTIANPRLSLLSPLGQPTKMTFLLSR